MSKGDNPLILARKYPAASNNSIVSKYFLLCSSSSRASIYFKRLYVCVLHVKVNLWNLFVNPSHLPCFRSIFLKTKVRWQQSFFLPLSFPVDSFLTFLQMPTVLIAKRLGEEWTKLKQSLHIKVINISIIRKINRKQRDFGAYNSQTFWFEKQLLGNVHYFATIKKNLKCYYVPNIIIQSPICFKRFMTPKKCLTFCIGFTASISF